MLLNLLNELLVNVGVDNGKSKKPFKRKMRKKQPKAKKKRKIDEENI